MSIFVTVGTTRFDLLVSTIDKGQHASIATLQVANGEYEPQHANWFRFTSSIDEYIDKADIVICHAGAGSIFNLLQAGHVPIVVPNTVRRDKHQLEIARWLDRNNFAVVAFEPEEVNVVIDNYAELKNNCAAFNTPRFFYSENLNQLISGRTGA